MKDLNEELNQTFESQLRQQEELLRVAQDRYEESREILKMWPVRQKKFGRGFLDRFDRWKAQLKHIIRPLNLKRYKLEKKRLKRIGYIALGSSAGIHLLGLRFLNILRLLLLVLIYFGVPAFLIYILLDAAKMI